MEEMSLEPTPWADAVAELLQKPIFTKPGWSFNEVEAIIKAACEAHAKSVFALSVDTAKLQSERDQLAAQLKLANEDWAEDDTAIRDLCRPILGDAAVEGDSYGVPSVVELVEKLVGELKRNDTRTPI